MQTSRKRMSHQDTSGTSSNTSMEASVSTKAEAPTMDTASSSPPSAMKAYSKASVRNMKPRAQNIKPRAQNIKPRPNLQHSSAQPFLEPDRTQTADAQASCLQLCNKMQSRLPRELRDMVYEYLSPEEPLQVIYGKFESNDFVKSEMYKQLQRHVFGTTPPSKPSERANQSGQHYITPEYMGWTTFQEYGERFFETLCLSFSHLKNLSPIRRYRLCSFNIRGFLQQEIYPLGYTMRSIIANVEIDLRSLKMEEFVEYRLAMLEDLFLLKEAARIKLILGCASPHNPVTFSINKFLADVHLLAARLKDAGYRVVIELKSDCCNYSISDSPPDSD